MFNPKSSSCVFRLHDSELAIAETVVCAPCGVLGGTLSCGLPVTGTSLGQLLRQVVMTLLGGNVLLLYCLGRIFPKSPCISGK